MGTPLLNISLKEPENFLKNSAPSACRCSIFVKFRVKSAAYSQPVCSRLTIESHYLLQICFSFASDFRSFHPSSTVSTLCRLATLQFRISAVSQSCCVATVLTNSSIFLNSRTTGKTARQKPPETVAQSSSAHRMNAKHQNNRIKMRRISQTPVGADAVRDGKK